MMLTTERNFRQNKQEQKMVIRENIVVDSSSRVVFTAITDPNESIIWFSDNAESEGGSDSLSKKKGPRI